MRLTPTETKIELQKLALKGVPYRFTNQGVSHFVNIAMGAAVHIEDMELEIVRLKSQIDNAMIRAAGPDPMPLTPLIKTYTVEMPAPDSPDICAVIAINQIINDELGESYAESIPRVLDFVRGSWKDSL